MSDSTEPVLLSVRETARRLGVHENTVRNWARDGALPGVRVPGSRYRRFDERDVERLRLQRDAGVAGPAEPEQWSVGPELVDATELSRWAGTHQAQSVFPELVRRLLASTPGVTSISVRANDGVALPGWDGVADAIDAAFLPSGSLAFEFGVGKNPRSKANDDYEKRRENSLGLEPSRTCFIFMTPRRWTDAPRWQAEHQADGVFADVRVLDADALEGWLRSTPAVHYWISEQLGRRPGDAETLERWWQRFSTNTQPPLPASLFLAGRADEAAQLNRTLAEPPAITTVATTWNTDALGFIYGALDGQEDEASETRRPCIVVKSEAVWDELTQRRTQSIVIPVFDNPDVAGARDRGHHVILLADDTYATTGPSIRLPRVFRPAAREALELSGVPTDRAYELSALARRSMPALVRSLSRDPRISQPLWATPPASGTLAPLALAGAWTTSQADTEVLSRLAEATWSSIERQITSLPIDDPLFINGGNQWYLASSQEAILLLARRLSSADVHRWKDIALEVLSDTDPALSLTAEERPAASLLGKSRRLSGVLRKGMANGLVLVSMSDLPTRPAGRTGSEHVDEVVAAVLRQAEADPSGRAWQSLADVLPRLAEASPKIFLDAIHRDLDTPEPLLTKMFSDSKSSTSSFSSSPHTGLLWALETLCWSAEFFADGVLALAGLQVLDPGGRLANRPMESLASIMVGWIRHTQAPLPIKIDALRAIIRRFPEVGWMLLENLWPQNNSFVTPPSSPEFRDWQPESQIVTSAEWFRYITEIDSLTLELAGRDLNHWGNLVGRIGALPPSERERFFIGLEGLMSEISMTPEQQLSLWEKIHAEVRKHERFADADWAMDAEGIRRLRVIAESIEPTTDTQRFAYLFDWHPDLPGVICDEADTWQYMERLNVLRMEAINRTMTAGGLEALQDLALRVAVPTQLGPVIAQVGSWPNLESLLLTWLDSAHASLRDTSSSWARSRMLERREVRWMLDRLGGPELQIDERRQAFVLQIRQEIDAWDALAEADPNMYDYYWRTAMPFGIEPVNAERAVRELLKRDRAWPAVEVLSMSLRRSETGSRPDARLIKDVLQSALGAESLDSSRNPGYEIGTLIDELKILGEKRDELATYEFAFFNLLEHYRPPKNLYSAISDDADLFVDLVSRVYRGKHEAPSTPSETDRLMARHAYRVLHAWSYFPGRRDDGSIDATAMEAWVRSARLSLAEADRADLGDSVIGQALAWTPEDEDGVWPAKPVRELIESIASESMSDGIHIGILNRRGVTTRSPYAGGDKERELANRYARWANKTTAWPRTTRVLRAVADSYLRQAAQEDLRAQIISDTE